jgi:hypothetical protein
MADLSSIDPDFSFAYRPSCLLSSFTFCSFNIYVSSLVLNRSMISWYFYLVIRSVCSLGNGTTYNSSCSFDLISMSLSTFSRIVKSSNCSTSFEYSSSFTLGILQYSSIFSNNLKLVESIDCINCN